MIPSYCRSNISPCFCRKTAKNGVIIVLLMRQDNGLNAPCAESYAGCFRTGRDIGIRKSVFIFSSCFPFSGWIKKRRLQNLLSDRLTKEDGSSLLPVGRTACTLLTKDVWNPKIRQDPWLMNIQLTGNGKQKKPFLPNAVLCVQIQ